MRFFDREMQLERLRTIRTQSGETSQFTVLTGRRRIGKTELVKRAFDRDGFVYLFVSRKSEPDLVEGFIEELNRVFPEAVSCEIRTLEGFFREVFKFARSTNLTVFIDEFQDFVRVNPSVFSILQGLWDREHDRCRLNLIVCGSVNSLMNRIFRDRKEPLYGRQTAMMRLEPFTPQTLKEILRFHSPRFAPEDLLALWTFTGGVAKYVALLMDAGATTFRAMLNAVVAEDSFFLDEGRTLLGDEFGKGYSVYFSILSAIARGATVRNEIEQIVGRQVGGYLTRLEEDYHLVGRTVPFGAANSRMTRYRISDSFYRFWFRFVFRYEYMVQAGAFDLLRKVVKRDYPAFSGFALESYFVAKFAQSGDWGRIGNWWDRKGENEIDIIADNELTGKMVVAEVKRDRRRIDLDVLRRKFAVFSKMFSMPSAMTPEFVGLSIDDM